MDFKILIPSYGRAIILKKKTLALLERHNVPKNNIYIFLQDNEQFIDYELDQEYNVIITGAEGIENTRNYLQDWVYSSDLTRVLHIDDDILNITDTEGKSLENFIEFTKELLNDIDKAGLGIGGICAYSNKFYLKDTTSKSLKYIIGAFRAEIVRRDRPIVKCSFSHFEDVQFTCEYFKRDGGVYRKNGYGLKTLYFNPNGGIIGSMGGLQERQRAMDMNSKAMVHLYPNMVRIVYKKIGVDLRLNHHYKNDITIEMNKDVNKVCV